MTNNGSFLVQAGSGGTRFVEGVGTFTNAATGTMAVDDILNSSGGTSVVNQGSLSLTEQWTIPGAFNSAGGTVSATGAGQVVSSGSTTIGNGSSSGNVIVVTGGSLAFSGPGATSVLVIGGANLTGTIPAGQVLTVSGTNAQNTTVSLQGNVVNNGTIVETSTGGGFANIELNSFSLTNNGSFLVQAGSGGTRFVEGVGTFTNAATGTMTVDQGLTSNGLTAVVNQGSLTLTQQWTVPGSFTMTSGSVASSGAGLVVASGTTVMGNGSTSGTPVRVIGGNLQFTGTVPRR
ncbi:MAG: hypothetical protein U0W40_05605 [Acidimicrobiia bacterium]